MLVVVRELSVVPANLTSLTTRAAKWEISHMQKQISLVKADDKGRVPIRGTKKGHQYLVTAEKGGWWVMPAPKVKTPTREMETLVAESWEKLGPAPEIDYDKL